MTLIRIILAFIVFSFYNALSIKGLTATWQWHIAQFCFMFLLLFDLIFDQSKKIYNLWKRGDFHKFGEMAWKTGAAIVVLIAVYVESLHWFLPRIIEWMK